MVVLMLLLCFDEKRFERADFARKAKHPPTGRQLPAFLVSETVSMISGTDLLVVDTV